MHSEQLAFTGASGARLAARLDLPPGGEPVACALFAHCFTCSKNLNAVVNISRALGREGVAVLRFDFTGLGESEGDFAATNFTTSVGDLVAAAEFLAGRGMAPSLLVGHSLGGAAALVAAPRIPSLAAVATLCAPSDPWHLTGLLREARERVEAEGEATVDLGGRPFTVRRQLLDDLRQASVEAAMRRVELPLLVLHSPVDRVVELEHATRIFRSAQGPRSFVSLDGADHLLSDRRDAAYAGRVIAAWASRYLPEPAAPTVAELIADGRVSAETGASGFRTEVRAGRHVMVVDEPAAVSMKAQGGTRFRWVKFRSSC